jgi:hypothetical protein
MILQPLLSFCEWMAETAGSIALHESLYMYPLVESVHVLTLCLFVGFASILDLRLLGLALRHVPVKQVAERLLPWTIGGFVVMVITGVLLFYAIPVRSFQSVWFRLKVIMLVLAGINVWVFHTRIYLSVDGWGLDAVPPRAARIAGACSLILWGAIIVAGRMIAYNWFDCDLQPQSDFINWAAGCVVPPQ